MDEPVQWHLATTAHDRCPWCGLNDVGNLGKRQRVCMNSACGVTLVLPIPPQEFLARKMRGEVLGNGIYRRGPAPSPLSGEVSLVAAQESSRDHTARVGDPTYAVSGDPVIWRQGDYTPCCPRRALRKTERVAAAGSRLWHYLRAQSIWVPNQPYSALEQLAKEGFDPAPQQFARLVRA